jgi:hypothetical protein
MNTPSEAVDLAADVGELVIDAQLSEGIVKDIPFLSSAVSIVRISRTIADRLFAKKIRQLLLQLHTVTEADRSAFRERMSNDPVYATKVGECLVFTCQQLDSTAKAEMLGVAFAAHLKGQISVDLFRRLATAISAGFVDDLHLFAISGDDPFGLVEGYMFRLTHTGLTSANAELKEGPFGSSVENDCFITDTGQAFLKFIGPHYEKRKAEFIHLRKRG